MLTMLIDAMKHLLLFRNLTVVLSLFSHMKTLALTFFTVGFVKGNSLKRVVESGMRGIVTRSRLLMEDQSVIEKSQESLHHH